MRKHNLALILLISLLVLFSLTCGLSASTETPNSQETDLASTMAVMQMTQTAMAAATTSDTEAPPSPKTPPQGQPPQSPAPQPGSISGALSYPSEGIPPLRVVAFNVNSGYYYYLEMARNQDHFRIDGLPPGSYHVVAYVMEGVSLSGGYTQAVLCGTGANCSDHSLVDVQVQADQETSGVDPIDWYAPPGSFPPDPVAPPQPSGDIPPASGKISGQLSYPSEGIPPLRVVAFDVTTGTFYFIETVPNQGVYVIENLPQGTYHVVAYVIGADPGSPGAGYSQAVPCGLAVNCTDHSLINVQVNSGQETPNVNPTDWYAPEGAFPANPMP